MDLLVKVQVDVESDKVISNSTPFENAVDKLCNEREKINGYFSP